MDEYNNNPDLSGNQPQNGNTQPENYQAGYQQPPQQPNYNQQGYQQPPQQPDYSQQGYQQPPQYTVYPQPAPQPGYVQKSKIAAGILGILVGAFGVHNFYLGYTGKAIAQLLISVLSCGFLAAASAIWGLVEGIMILTGSINVDAAGVPLKD